jgi:rsbT co-antagonist protein RsbR
MARLGERAMADDDRLNGEGPVTDLPPERRRRFVNLVAEDVARIAEVKGVVVDHRGEHAAAFFDHLQRFDDGGDLFRRPELLAEARRMKEEHLIALVGGDYDREYVEQRAKLGLMYSRAHVDMRAFLGAFQAMMTSIARRVDERFGADGAAATMYQEALRKVLFLDLGIIQDVMIAEREQTIVRQQQAIRELSTPTLQLRDRLLILPIIGLMDTFRARQLTETLLREIRDRRAKVVVMDITGVATVDSKVANHLIQTVAAARLMGARVIVTGLSADVAQSLVTLGVDLTGLDTVGDLQGGLEQAERILGYETRRMARAPTAADD